MRLRFRIHLISLGLTLCLVAGLAACSRRPEAAKRKYVASGNQFAARGEAQKAAIQYLNAIRIDPRFAAAHYGLGKAALAMNDADTAFLEFLQTTELDPENLDAQIQLGNLYFGRGDKGNAKKRADLVAQQQPSNLEAHLLLAQLWSAAGDRENRDAELAKSFALAGPSPKPYLVQAQAQMADGKLDAAIATYEKALTLDKDNLDVLIGLSRVYELQKKYPEAERVLQSAVRLQPRNPNPRMRLVMLEVVLNKYDYAEQVAREGKSASPQNPVAATMLGNLYIWTNQIDKASQEYADITKAQPQNQDSIRVYVQLLIYQDKLDQAEALNTQQLAAMGADPGALIEQGEILIRRQRPAEAVKVLRSALQIGDNIYLGHYYLGVALALVGEHEGALREWQRAAQLNPASAAPQLALADLAAMRGDPTLAFKSANRLMQIEPNSARSYVIKATSEFAVRKNAAGEADLQQAIKAGPADPVGYLAMAEYRAARGQWPAAQQMAEDALQRDPGQAKALEIVARAMQQRGQGSATEARVEQQIAKQPNNSNFHLLLGELKLNRADNSGAEASLQRATELQRTNGDAWRLLGLAQARAGNLNATAATYQKWADFNPQAALPSVLLGELADGRNDWKAAEEFYRKALVIEPKNPTAANNLSYLMVEHGQDVTQAISYAMKARDAQPASPTYLDTLGWAYYSNKQYKTAAEMLRKALKQAPNKAAVEYHLGMCYDKLKDRQNARLHLARALQLEPAFPHAEEIRALLKTY